MVCEYSYDVIRGSNAWILWLKVVLDPGVEYEFLEPMTNFLAFLVGSKDRPERAKSFADILGHFRGFPELT